MLNIRLVTFIYMIFNVISTINNPTDLLLLNKFNIKLKFGSNFNYPFTTFKFCKKKYCKIGGVLGFPPKRYRHIP